MPHKISLNGDKDWISSAVLSMSRTDFRSILCRRIPEYMSECGQFNIEQFHCTAIRLVTISLPYKFLLGFEKKILKYNSNHDFESSSFHIFQNTLMARETPSPSWEMPFKISIFS